MHPCHSSQHREGVRGIGTELLDIGESLRCSESRFAIDLSIVQDLQLNGLFHQPISTWPMNTISDYDRQLIPTLISTPVGSNHEHQNSVNFANLIEVPLVNNYSYCSRITTRITSRSFVPLKGINSRNQLNLIKVNTSVGSRLSHSRLRLATWNIRSLNKKAVPVCDLVISKRIDILALNETWLSSYTNSDPTVANIISTLQDYNFVHHPRSSRSGGGVGVLLKSSLKVKCNESHTFNSFEYLDLFITSGSSSFRLLCIYRPPPSKKNKLTTTLFFDEFSVLVQDLAIATETVIITGDFNFHVERPDANAMKFLDILDAGGFDQNVRGITHKHGHTLDLIITRQGDLIKTDPPKIVNGCFDISDHLPITCDVYIQKPPPTKKRD